jgi:hypothetical protein
VHRAPYPVRHEATRLLLVRRYGSGRAECRFPRVSIWKGKVPLQPAPGCWRCRYGGGCLSSPCLHKIFAAQHHHKMMMISYSSEPWPVCPCALCTKSCSHVTVRLMIASTKSTSRIRVSEQTSPAKSAAAAGLPMSHLAVDM